MTTWWDVDELLGETELDDSSEDNLTAAEQALIDRTIEIDAIIQAEIYQPYPTVSADFND